MFYWLLIALSFLFPAHECRVTSYAYHGVTATGVHLTGHQRIVAVSPAAEKLFPLHSYVWISGHGIYRVEDRTARWL